MTYDFCLGCGVLLPQYVSNCPICGFDNCFDENHDIQIDDVFLNDLSDEFNPDENFW
jgi:hypothetical protein